MSKRLIYIVIIGLVLRLIFVLFGAEIYYGKPDFAFFGGDTWAWIKAMQNLVHHGTFTIDLNFENGKFYRPPGYSFFMLPFYLLSGFSIDTMVIMVIALQIALDIISIILFYHISKQFGLNENASLIAAFLYAIFPFAIVWTPVLYAESSSIFFLLLSIYYFTKEGFQSKNAFIAGAALGIATLLRLQCALIVFSFLFYYLHKQNFQLRTLFNKSMILWGVGLLVSYGIWPIRNLTYGEFILTEQIENEEHFSKDYVAFMFYVWSIQTDHQPEYDQLMNSNPVKWPKAAYLTPTDSTTLAEVSKLCSTCGRGFSYFQASAGIKKEPIKELNECSISIANTFDRLRQEQIRNNSFHYYVTVPLSNLKKAIFKNALYGNNSLIKRIISSCLFGLRTLLILLGLFSLFYCLNKGIINPASVWFIFSYFLILYLYLSFVYRNIEIRYFLHVDIILLIPTAALINYLIGAKVVGVLENKTNK